jgi:hypothetical protein
MQQARRVLMGRANPLTGDVNGLWSGLVNSPTHEGSRILN